jgi:threonine 3-dehydrogenase
MTQMTRSGPEAVSGAPPATMRALRKLEAGRGARLVEVPVPSPGPDDLLIEVESASICGTDLHIFDWDPWAAGRIERLPMTFGHEIAGRVVATGREVHGIRSGAFVSLEGHLFCGQCVMCQTGRRHICERIRILGVDVDGGFADYVVCPARNAWEVDPRIAPDIASIHDPFGNAVHTVFGPDEGTDVPMNGVAVLGCGPIGLFAVGIARAMGAAKVIAVEPNGFRLSLAREMGADLAIDPTEEDPVEGVLAATGGRGVEVVLEMSGIPAVIAQGTRMLSHGGRMSLLGLPSGPVSLELTDDVIFKEARLYGVTGREIFRTWRQMSILLGSGMVDPSPVITHRFPLEAFDEAFETMRSGRSGKIVLLPRAAKPAGRA